MFNRFVKQGILRQDRGRSVGIVVVLISAIVMLGAVQSVLAETESGSVSKYVAVSLGNRTIKATLANTNASRIEGLLGWKSINDDSGMLLDFPREGIYSIHMEGMKFGIDAIWVDSKDTIRLIYENILPDSGVTYPSMFPSRYCLEVKAGFCKRFSVRSGQRIKISDWPSEK